ncbi:hypothetical protein GIB67_019233 [Kingdonia uniflora]|uniref:F-box domain-containing protein n=1 Tax=Kingdonia uniflora TaxID=39325 RepID=A0A7J7N084_9MAGN|nr:hypothetical protein GIB67_019233 [Kingdonia uniflora]
MASFRNCRTGTISPLCSSSGKGAKKSLGERVIGESSLRRDFEDLSVSRRLARSVSEKFRRKGRKSGEEDGNERISSGCLGLYGKGGGCKVGIDTSELFGDGICRGKSSVGEESKGYELLCGTEKPSIDCFSYKVTEKIWKKNDRKKEKEIQAHRLSSIFELLLPDELLEMCLMRLPLTSLMTARLVCKKWRCLTTTNRFMQMRAQGFHQSPWLFVFGLVKDGFCDRQIHALDVSLDQWHTIESDILRGRFMFSVASVGNEVYAVGGCSSLTNFGRVDKSSFKTHKGVVVFNPASKSWRKVAPMKSARSSPILGVFKVGSDCLFFHGRNDRQDPRFTRSRMSGISNVYEDPHRLSLRRQHEDIFNEAEARIDTKRNERNFVNQERTYSNQRGLSRYLLIAVGGLGSFDEPLDSGEIYDPVSNRWIGITRLPRDFGVVCSGVVCNSMFYVYSEMGKVAAYDLEKYTWVRIQTARSPPRLHEYYPKLVSWDRRLFLLSVSWCEQDIDLGWREKAVRKLWELDPILPTWTEISTHPDAPMDWNAAFVSDRGHIFGLEMFKIFGQVLDFLTVYNLSDSRSEWRHISGKHLAHEMCHKMDASSCVTKSLAILHL